jgi:hypothetical protein
VFHQWLSASRDVICTNSIWEADDVVLLDAKGNW